ncbi:thioredoxin domain-containing protein [Aestuariibaculum sp. YM273]|uniref:thioredoxin family protein n=1 Tax=Aestuariibaculum sp. YM273 TaxID=3070659 RepID=UPI0027DBA616|nr:thioredoxin domain-containing protein [Aestuariibaculum sp. YM273]WMI66020.1 thioredoxin domain-containing protein [Aestuariibaculum sp. YM273]
MKKVLVSGVLLLLLSVTQVFAQGIDFQHITLEEALQKAEKENKLVFIDFYTTWCAPCKSLAKFVFPLEEVGVLYNKEFVSIKLDAEKEGLTAARKYGVTSYPTLMFLNPEGKAVYKETGALPKEKLIELGHKAVASVSSEYSLVKLREEFPNRQNDEHFLRIYIDKMIEYGQSPDSGIEAWLKVQTEIEEDDVDMMEFLLNHANYLVAEGKAEAVFNANFDEYMDIATFMEERRLDNIRVGFVNKTLLMARNKKSEELMKTFLDKWYTLPDDFKKKSDIKVFEMEYLRMLDDKKGYTKLAQTYIDSLMAANTVQVVKKEDQESYAEYKKQFDERPSKYGQIQLEKYERGIRATSVLYQVDAFVRSYFKYLGATKKNYKTVKKWIDYGNELVDKGSYLMASLESDILNQLGKKKEALELKQFAFENWPEKDKYRVAIQRQLNKMKKDLSI